MNKDETDNLNASDINAIKFEAAFYADLDLLKQLVVSKENLRIALPISKDHEWLWNTKTLYINILDLLNWLAEKRRNDLSLFI